MKWEAELSSLMRAVDPACGLDHFSSCAWQPASIGQSARLAVFPLMSLMTGRGIHRLKVLTMEEEFPWDEGPARAGGEGGGRMNGQ